jgi:polyhydroxybutyrate depolymerase
MTKSAHEPSGGPDVTNGARRGQAFPRLKPGTLLRFTDSSPAYPYILRVPEQYLGDEAFPLLVYLSGGPGLAMDAANGSDDALAGSGYVVLYPDAGGEMWWTKKVAERFPALLEEVRRTVNIDPRRIYIAGFSNGATGAAYYATLWPGQFAAAALLMGAGRCISDFKLNVDKLAGMPVLLVHGDRDPIIPTSCSEDLFKALRKVSPAAPPQLHVLKKREHDVIIGADDGLTLRFLDAIEAKRRAAQ